MKLYQSIKTVIRKQKASSPRGYIALLSVIALGAVGLAITTSLILTGILSSRTNFAIQQQIQARIAATSCAEEALRQILDTEITSGTGTLTFESSSCVYTITSTSSSPLVQAEGISGAVISKINVILASSSPRIKLSSWQEVGDF
jgi:hypothetical protein